MKKRPIILLLFTFMIGIGSLLAGSPAFASKLSDLKNQKEQISNERGHLESKIDDANEQINKLQSEQASVRNQIERYDLAINDTAEKIREKNEQIGETKQEIATLKVEITELEERIAKRNELLKDRARNFQETGGLVSYLDVLMGASTFSDFVDRVSAVATIMEADQDILRKHSEDKELLETKKAEVETKLANLEKMRKDLEGLKASLNTKKAEQNKLLAQLEYQEDQIHNHKMEAQEQAEILAAQEKAIQRAIQLEKERLAELERKRREAEKNKANGGSSSATPPVSNGTFTKPAAGVFTSGFGHRWGRFHYGIDIANRSSVPIVAAADGVVIRSYYSPSYGNVVFLAHSINGQIFTTVYAHMSVRHVGEGAVVSKGQQLGIMGNTGDSQGQHLHFEVHKGPWNDAKSNAVNPLNYVPI
ncbi:murein hydrolase activator EnvC family protein [Pseudoneobacillus sp. C159]